MEEAESIMQMEITSNREKKTEESERTLNIKNETFSHKKTEVFDNFQLR